MPTYRFYQVDVFTNQAFGGNPLAVFPDAEGLTPEMMQRIAREMNLSETTFVFPPTVPGADYKVRIFMPERELPFAGHPVIGTQWLLAHLGRTKLQEPSVTVKFELGVGVRSSILHITNNKVTSVVMDHQKPEFGSKATAAQIAELAQSLNVPAEAILDTGWPVQMVSTGVRQLFAPLRSLKEVQGISAKKLDVSRLARVCEALDPIDQCNYELMVFCTETVHASSTVHTRMFAPGIGVPEDPATGSASGGLGAYLIENGVIAPTPPTTYIISEQGLEMGRPSTIEIEVDGTPGDVQMIRVGGEVMPLIEGSMSW
ncbi:MAG: PhzF family phenazine biosynthesis protein [Chloroflexota bacterium]